MSIITVKGNEDKFDIRIKLLLNSKDMEDLGKAVKLMIDAATIDGEHHKQWLIVEALKEMGIDMALYGADKGIAP